MNTAIKVKDLNAFFGETKVVNGVNFSCEKKEVLALIGPSGCGKSTLIRCINRLHEETPGAKAMGEIFVNGENVLAHQVDPVLVRSKVGMVFQKPNPFPTLSVFENVVVGLKLSGVRTKSILEESCERALKQAALWNEVKDQLKKPGSSLSGGQQQRLCIARALAVNPSILLMDEPTSALDPISTAKIEDLIEILKGEVTILIVTHNMQQAMRVSDRTAFMLWGELIEIERTAKIFSNPVDERTTRYISGKFG